MRHFEGNNVSVHRRALVACSCANCPSMQVGVIVLKAGTRCPILTYKRNIHLVAASLLLDPLTNLNISVL
jgi:hypothetical protein